MKASEITALAREYAEEISPVNLLNDYPEAKMIADMMRNALSEATANQIKDFEGFLRFLLRRYCLVEKANAKQFFQSRQHILKHQDEYDRYIVDEASAEKRLMLCLFPEIAKEVEDEES